MDFKPLSQKDPRWANKKLGTGTIADRGCTVVSIAMLGGITPDRVVDNADFTSEGAIYWASLSRLGYTFHWRGYTYENEKVLEAIEKYGGCLVEVLHPSGFKHWVLFIGDKKMIDPLTGKVEATSKYPNLTGYAIIEPPEKEPDDSELVWLRKELEELRVKYAQLEGTVAEKNAAISQLTENEKRWQKEAKSATANLGKVLEEKGELEKTIASLERRVDKLEKELAEMEKEKNANWQLYKKALEGQTDKQTSLQLITILFNRLYNIMKSLFIKKSVDSSNTK